MNRIFHDRFMNVHLINEETPETKSFSFNWSGEPIEFTPGQFFNVTAELPDRQRIRRAYSIASSPIDPELELTVKKMEGGLLSSFLCDDVRTGDSLNIRGPYGRFTLEDDGRRLVFIAAGSGIVPFRSMWRHIRQTGSKTMFSLLYASKSQEHIIYRDEIAQLSKEGYPIAHTLTRNNDPQWKGYSRRIDRDMLIEFVGDFTHPLFYVCGPPDFCNCIVRDLRDLGVQRDRIKTEKYD
jgi:ferredoxin-NADP reductase